MNTYQIWRSGVDYMDHDIPLAERDTNGRSWLTGAKAKTPRAAIERCLRPGGKDEHRDPILVDFAEDCVYFVCNEDDRWDFNFFTLEAPKGRRLYPKVVEV